MKKWIVMAFLFLTVAAIGPNPRFIEELSIGGGKGETVDGGADFEKDGRITTDGDINTDGQYQTNGTPIATSDLADGGDVAKVTEPETIAADWDNSANPWSDDEVSDTLTVGAAGSVNDSALSGNVPLKNAAETITAPWTFSDIAVNGGTISSTASTLTLDPQNGSGDVQVANTLSIAGQSATLSKDHNQFTRITVSNTDSGINAHSDLQLQTDLGSFLLIAHGSGRPTTRYGQALAGWVELLNNSMDGIAIGSANADDILFGTNDAARLRITGGGDVHFPSGSLTGPSTLNLFDSGSTTVNAFGGSSMVNLGGVATDVAVGDELLVRRGGAQFGDADTSFADLVLHGNATSEGPRMSFQNAADDDTSTDAWEMRSGAGGHFQINASGGSAGFQTVIEVDDAASRQVTLHTDAAFEATVTVNPSPATVTTADATPDVAGRSLLDYNPPSTVTITNFDNLSDGQVVYLVNRSASAVTVNETGNIRVNGGSTITLNQDEGATFLSVNGVARQVG